MIRRPSADIAAAATTEATETLLGRFLLRMPSAKTLGDREMGPFLNSSSLSGLACTKAKHGFRISRKPVKTR